MHLIPVSPLWRHSILFTLACFALALSSCSDQDTTATRKDFKWIAHGRAKPIDPTPLSSKQLDKLKHCTDLREIIRFNRYIVLQGNRFRDVPHIVRVQNFFFVLDSHQKAVFKYDLQGNFLQEIGRKGQGPGEFEWPLLIKRSYGDTFAVWDGIRGRITVFDLDGSFIAYYDQMTTKGRIIPGNNFIWNSPNRLAVAAFGSQEETGPWHVLLEKTGRDFEVVTGFGERFEPFKRHKLGLISISIFEAVGDQIWVASPCSILIDVYDKDGQFLHQVGSKFRPNGIPRDYFDKIPNDPKKGRAYRSTLFDYDAPRALHQLGELVLVRYRASVCVFDRKGNVIRDQLTGNPSTLLCDTYGTEAYFLQGIGNNGKNLDDAERDDLVQRLGVDLETADDQGLLLWVGELAMD